MVQIAVADGTMAAPLDLYHVADQFVTAATGVPTADGNARDVQTGGADREWGYLAEGFAWVLDACD